MEKIHIKIGDTVDVEGEKYIVKKIEYVYSDTDPCIIIGFRDENDKVRSVGYRAVRAKS